MRRVVFAAVLLAGLLDAPPVLAMDAGASTLPISMKSEPASQPASQPIAITPPADDLDLWGAIQSIIGDFKEGRVWNGVSAILMVLTFIFFKVKKELPVKYAVWIAAGLGIATNIVSAIIGGVGWGPAITAGLYQGAAAGGFWTMVGKHIFRSRDEKAKRARAREIARE